MSLTLKASAEILETAINEHQEFIGTAVWVATFAIVAALGITSFVIPACLICHSKKIDGACARFFGSDPLNENRSAQSAQTDGSAERGEFKKIETPTQRI